MHNGRTLYSAQILVNRSDIGFFVVRTTYSARGELLNRDTVWSEWMNRYTFENDPVRRVRPLVHWLAWDAVRGDD